jgi:DNA-directed RNA polymerase specialized sigma24 family protein
VRALHAWTSDWLAERFEEHRTRLRAVDYRMLGSLPEADDAVQEGLASAQPLQHSRDREPGRLA